MYVKWYAVACTRPCINKADYREAIQALHIFVQAAFPEAGLSYLTHLFVDLVAKKPMASYLSHSVALSIQIQIQIV